MFVLNGPERPVHSLAFAPDAATLYAVHSYVGVQAWNLADRTATPLETDDITVFGEFALHPGGRWAFGRLPGASGGSGADARAIDLTTGRAKPLNFLGVVGQDIATSSDGRRVVTGGHSAYDPRHKPAAPTYRLYGWTMTATGPKYAWHRDTPEDAGVHRVVYLGNDALVTEDHIPTGPRFLGYQPTKPRLCVRSATDGEPRRTIDSPSERIEQLLASPDGAQVVVRRGTSLWVYVTTDWKRPPAAVEGKHTNFLNDRGACFHPSAPYLLLANNGPSVIVFDTTTWKPVRKWNWKAGTLRAVAVSPDGTLAAAGGPRGRVVVWDLD